MKRFNSILACALVFAAAGLAALTNVVKADANNREAHATVRAVHGDCTYSDDNGATWKALRPNMDLSQGAMIKTAMDAQADLQVNGRTSTVRVTSGTTVTLKVMTNGGAYVSPDTETQLDMANGLVVGTVKKISGGSTYRVSTPRGVAGIRGTDFAVQVTAQANGTYTVTFSSITGEVICVANISINGATTPVTKILTTGQSWTPPDSATSEQAAIANIVPVAQFLIDLIPSAFLPVPGGPPTTIIIHVPPNTTPTYTGGNGGTSSQPSPQPKQNPPPPPNED